MLRALLEATARGEHHADLFSGSACAAHAGRAATPKNALLELGIDAAGVLGRASAHRHDAHEHRRAGSLGSRSKSCLLKFLCLLKLHAKGV